MLIGFIANLLGAFVAILTLSPMYIGLIRDARKSGCKEISGPAESAYISYIGGCGMTVIYSLQLSVIISGLLEKGG